MRIINCYRQPPSLWTGFRSLLSNVPPAYGRRPATQQFEMHRPQVTTYALPVSNTRAKIVSTCFR